MKKPQKPAQVKPKQLISLAIKEKIIEALKVGLNHPVTAALIIMTASTVAQIALKPSENNGSKTAKDINYQLGGLYSGAQGIATAAVVVPVAMTALQAAGSAAAAYFTPAPSAPTGVKPPP